MRNSPWEKAVDYWQEKYPETLNPRFTKEFILDGIKIILENNIFCFNDTYFKQEKGTAMGTKFAPVYATLTIGYLEEKLLNHGLQSRPPSPKRAERKVRRRPFREAGSGQNNGTR